MDVFAELHGKKIIHTIFKEARIQIKQNFYFHAIY